MVQSIKPNSSCSPGWNQRGRTTTTTTAHRQKQSVTCAGCSLCTTSRTPSTASTTLLWTGCSRMPSVALLSRYSDIAEHTRGRAAVALKTAACTVSCFFFFGRGKKQKISKRKQHAGGTDDQKTGEGRTRVRVAVGGRKHSIPDRAIRYAYHPSHRAATSNARYKGGGGPCKPLL